MFSKLRAIFLAVLVTGFYRALSCTWVFVHVRRPLSEPEPCIFAHWHGDELALVKAFSRRGMAVLASTSRDGEMMKRVLSWMGYRVTRGSSTRGGAAGLKGLIDAVNKEKREASLAVDGPRGPIYRVKPGVLKLAQQTTQIIIPGAVAADRKYVFKNAWNRCYLPLPFAKCIIVYGDPVEVRRDDGPEALEATRVQLETTLRSLKKEAEYRASSGEYRDARQ